MERPQKFQLKIFEQQRRAVFYLLNFFGGVLFSIDDWEPIAGPIYTFENSLNSIIPLFFFFFVKNGPATLVKSENSPKKRCKFRYYLWKTK